MDEAADIRAKQHWLSQQLAEESRFLATLQNLAEARVPLGLVLTGTDVLRCKVGAVGADFVHAVDDFANEHLVALAAINRIETDSARAAAGEPRWPSPVEFWQAAAIMAEDRPEVAIHHLDGSGTRGELRSATVDEIRLRRLQPTHQTITIRLASVARISKHH